jgi:hypothetical protein
VDKVAGIPADGFAPPRRSTSGDRRTPHPVFALCEWLRTRLLDVKPQAATSYNSATRTTAKALGAEPLRTYLSHQLVDDFLRAATIVEGGRDPKKATPLTLELLRHLLKETVPR